MNKPMTDKQAALIDRKTHWSFVYFTEAEREALKRVAIQDKKLSTLEASDVIGYLFDLEMPVHYPEELEQNKQKAMKINQIINQYAQ